MRAYLPRQLIVVFGETIDCCIGELTASTAPCFPQISTDSCARALRQLQGPAWPSLPPSRHFNTHPPNITPVQSCTLIIFLLSFFSQNSFPFPYFILFFSPTHVGVPKNHTRSLSPCKTQNFVFGAPAGNRTRVLRVGGEDSATRPQALTQTLWNILTVLEPRACRRKQKHKQHHPPPCRPLATSNYGLWTHCDPSTAAPVPELAHFFEHVTRHCPDPRIPAAWPRPFPCSRRPRMRRHPCASGHTC